LEGGGDGGVLDAVPLVVRAASLRALSVWPGCYSHHTVRVANDSAAELARCLPGLKILRLAYNQMSSVGAWGLAGLVNLELLDLHDNYIRDEGAAALTSLTALTKLDLHSTNIGTPAVETLACLTNLVSLDVGGNLLIDDEGAKALAGMAHLTALCVSGRSFGESGVAALRATFGAEDARFASDTDVRIRWGRC
jgi:Leucine-rich repeat (LRR) protein